MASRDANVYLSSSAIMDSAMPFYDINFGAYTNTKTMLVRRTDDNLFPKPFATTWDTVIDRHRLNYEEFRDFWVSWDGGIIKHGRGSVIGVDIIGEWADSDPFPVSSIGVLNSYKTEGDWIIHTTGNYAGKHLKYR
ncbi:C3 and PZP-like alpha-2-macroglobulin domain-containing protein 8 [Mytilus edulis]|uniref:C3 and PZP-like alpha-2-macroglobulin domain-containing protein 8 n=1 Tax=Mytilus edulis TaxID=6550 RepID=UPI0039EEED8B